jgi:succinoglycan biosynthesis transport protein ExoP
MQAKSTKEEILELMRKNITFKTISADVADRRRGTVTIAFTISYAGRNPETVQKVTGTLASLYMEQNLKTREAQAKSTTQFLEAELKELKERIHSLGEQISTFKKEHEGLLPELYQFNMSQAERLENQIKQLDSNIQAAEDRRIYLEGQLATVNPNTPATQTTLTPQTRLRSLEVALAGLQAKYSETHPDIVKVRKEMAELKKQVKDEGSSASLAREKLANLKAKLAQIQGKYSDQHPDIRKLKDEIERLEKEAGKTSSSKTAVSEGENPAYINLRTQIHATTSDIAAIKRQRAILQENLQMFRQRLEETPKVEQEYLALQRDYTNATNKHQEVMNKILEARISEGMEEHQKGEKFTLLDPASYPEKPVKPPRLFIFLAGVLLSLGSGLGAVVIAEQLDHSVKTADELAWLSGLPVLGAIPRIETQEDLTQRKIRRRLLWGVSSLSLVLGLVIFHFYLINLWVLKTRAAHLLWKFKTLGTIY